MISLLPFRGAYRALAQGTVSGSSAAVGVDGLCSIYPLSAGISSEVNEG